MLQPSRTKFRKMHKGRIRGRSMRGAHVAFGEWGLQSMEGGLVTARQIEASRVAMARFLKKGGKIWLRIFPDKPITKKPAETRMGKGKGPVEGYSAVVRAGRVLFEIGGIGSEPAREALVLASHKLGLKTQIIGRERVRGLGE